jgi:hypothetical protein
MHSLLPWARAGELNVSVVDFTPNYICDADAMRSLHEGSAGHRSSLRFIVVVRDPIMRAFSEWAMFSLGWNWDPVKNFSASMGYKLRDLQQCNRTLFMRPDLLRQLPTHELAHYMRSCFQFGRATMYATNSMYGVCLEHALRYFEPSQFLVLRYEELMQMDGLEILRALSDFTGLHLGERQLTMPSCQPSRARRAAASRASAGANATGRTRTSARTKKPTAKPNSYSSNSPYAAEMLQEASAPLERFFGPYNELLRDVVGPWLGWSRTEHRKTPLSAEARAKALEAAKGYRQMLRNRQVARRINEQAKVNQVRAAVRARGAGAKGRGALSSAKGRGAGAKGRGAFRRQAAQQLRRREGKVLFAKPRPRPRLTSDTPTL